MSINDETADLPMLCQPAATRIWRSLRRPRPRPGRGRGGGLDRCRHAQGAPLHHAPRFRPPGAGRARSDLEVAHLDVIGAISHSPVWQDAAAREVTVGLDRRAARHRSIARQPRRRRRGRARLCPARRLAGRRPPHLPRTDPEGRALHRGRPRQQDGTSSPAPWASGTSAISIAFAALLRSLLRLGHRQRRHRRPRPKTSKSCSTKASPPRKPNSRTPK